MFTRRSRKYVSPRPPYRLCDEARGGGRVQGTRRLHAKALQGGAVLRAPRRGVSLSTLAAPGHSPSHAFADGVRAAILESLLRLVGCDRADASLLTEARVFAPRSSGGLGVVHA